MDQGSNEQSPEEPDTGGRAELEVGRRASESEHGLSKITHNALENMGALGHGLKQFFQPQRRRSSVSPHDSVSSCTGAPPSEPTDVGSEVGYAPASLALPLDSDNPAASAPPAALSRVLQQIRGAPPMKRGTSLQSRRSKVGGTGEPPQKGSPQIHRRSTHEALLQAGRPRSSSTTDTPSSPALADVLLTSGYHSTEEPDKLDRYDGSGPAVSPNALPYGADGYDVVDSTPDPQRTKQAIQSARIKQVFEKKNQKSAQTIQQLQRKLEHYHRKLREVEHNGIPRQPKDVFRDMHQGLKDVGAKVTGGLSSFSQATHSAAGAVVSKPREIASLIHSLDETQGDEGVGPGTARALGTGQLQSSPKYGSDDDCSSATSGSAGVNSTTGAPGGPPSSKGFDAILHEIQELRENQGRLEESFENLKSHYQRDYTMIMEALQEERYRCHIISYTLIEQLNDLTELHQNEILNLKQELASMEEKIAYQSYERARDIQEALEACQTRISRWSCSSQQQQVVQLEGLENATARTLLGKLINVLRTFSTLLLVILLAFLWRHWDAISEYLHHFLLHPR
uniref:Transmembrane and coiled-coil domain family 1b n=1 Tax=Cyclopterus lumpus TaxID=8103 RepID=A0A8C2ZE32_CYCLU